MSVYICIQNLFQFYEYFLQLKILFVFNLIISPTQFICKNDAFHSVFVHIIPVFKYRETFLLHRQRMFFYFANFWYNTLVNIDICVLDRHIDPFTFSQGWPVPDKIDKIQGLVNFWLKAIRWFLHGYYEFCKSGHVRF